MVNFGRGIANGTSILGTQNATDCQDSFIFIYDGVVESYEKAKSNFTLYGMLLAFDLFIDVPYHLYTVNYACYYGTLDAWEQMVAYTYFVSDPMVLLWNFIYNFGLMYNAFKDVLTYFIEPSRTKAKNTF